MYPSDLQKEENDFLFTRFNSFCLRENMAKSVQKCSIFLNSLSQTP